MRNTKQSRRNSSTMWLSAGLSTMIVAAGCSSHTHSSEDRTGTTSAAAQVSSNATSAGPASPTPSKVPAPPAPGASPGSPNPGAGPAPGPVVTYGTAVQTAMRDFQAVSATMSVVTGVPQTNASVAAAYQAQLNALPTGTDVTAFVGSNQVAIFQLAVEYCNQMVSNPTTSAAVFGNTTVTGAPSAVFTSTNSTAIATALINSFWGTGLSSLPPQTVSVPTITGLITSLLAGKSTTDPKVTSAVITAACTAVLASAPVTLY